MKYCSTLGGHRGLTFREALFSTGFMSDGGLLLPEHIPTVESHTLLQWKQLKYQELVFEIAKLYISEDEIPRQELEIMIREAFKTFTKEEILPVTVLKDGVKILEMFHGKTWAFKDLALSLVAKFIDYFMKQDARRVIILVGTSGDTGSAVLEAVRGLSNIDCIVLLPKGYCSSVQERQMTTVVEDNVHVFRVEGTSDDLDEPIKACFLDTDFSKQHGLMSVNSINWARIMVQIAHHFYAYFKICDDDAVTNDVEIVVPTGAMGNVTSGLIARRMGLPVRYVSAVTSNDVVDRMIRTGGYTDKNDIIDTMAKAMNIGNPYNVQRVISLFSDDVTKVKAFMNNLDLNNEAQIPDEILREIQSIITPYQGNDDVIKETIRRCYHDNKKYLLCPHTALAVAYHYQQHDNGNHGNRICLATASPVKFAEAVALSGISVPESDEVKMLMKKPTRYVDMNKGEDWEAILRQTIENISLKYMT